MDTKSFTKAVGRFAPRRVLFTLLTLLAPLALLVLSASCDSGPASPSFQPVLPELPDHWREVLGEPHWRLEWIGEGGTWVQRDISPTQAAADISPVQGWSSPVLAWPFWPERQLLPAMARPAGALFPWDVRGRRIVLSWEGGVDAVFWKELALAHGTSRPQASSRRLPWYFDWPRFRELFESETIAHTLRRDPWLADWKDIAERTVQSGFDRRRLTPRAFTEITVPGAGGHWVGSSPFAPPLDTPAGGPLRLNVTADVNTWAACGAVLRASSSGWTLREW